MIVESTLSPIIGLEIHCQLSTNSKLFCSCSSDFRNDKPNTHVCQVCLGLPGTLPVLNKKAVEFGIKVGMALNCEIQNVGIFCRKNYFYPDLTKAFQITMGDHPLATNGYLSIETTSGKYKKVNISRIHIEEDPGRLVHITNENNNLEDYTLVDYNRSGIPLVEIVTEPEMKSPKEARLFLNKLRTLLEYLNVFDPEKEGSIRVDANISFEGYNRVEIKNISSYRGVEKALTYEMERQKKLIEKKEVIIRETRHYHEESGITTSGRSKETEVDYRYFIEPDLPVIKVKNWVQNINLPELPEVRAVRFMSQYSISKNHADVLSSNLKLANFYEKVASINPLISSSWLVDVFIGELNFRNISIAEVLKNEEWIVEWIQLLNDKSITDKAAITVLRIILDQVASENIIEMPSTVVDKLNLGKKSINEFMNVIQCILSQNEKAISDHISGKKGALNYVIGKIMKETKGKIDPIEVKDMIDAILKDKY